MTTLREAAQQALEALLTYEQYIQPLTNFFGGPRVPEEGSASAKVDAAITAIKAALAEPPYHQYPLLADRMRIDPVTGDVSIGTPQRPTEPAQEPVAWISESENLLSWDKLYDHMKPLYTAPPQRKPRHISYVCPQCHWSLDERKPLTGEQLRQIELGLRIYYDNDRYDLSLHDFARAIERAHGIGEQP